MLRIIQKGPVSSDCTAPYDVEWKTDGRRSVSEFVAAVLRDKSNEWGNIYLIDDDRGWMHAPFVEYRCGSVVHVSERFRGWDDDREIDAITARGGWSSMDYFVRFKATEGTKEPAKDEGTKEETVFYAWTGVQAKRWPEEEGEYIVTIALDGRDERFVKLCGFVKDFRAAYGFGDAGPEWVFDRLPTGYPVYVESEFVHVVAWMPWPKAYRERS